MTHDGQPGGTRKPYVSGLKARNESRLMGNHIAIARRDLKLVWTLFPQQRVYTEKALDPRFQSAEMGAD